MASLPSRLEVDGITDLSHSLFENLQTLFDRVFSATCTAGSSGFPASELGVQPQTLIQLFRCCIKMLGLLEFDPRLLDEKRGILFEILRMLCPPYLHLHLHRRKGENLGTDLLTSLFSSMLEVFLHELFVHQQLRKHFTVSTMTERLFLPHHSHGNIDIIMELVSSHFLLSILDKEAFSIFIHSISGPFKFEMPEITLSVSIKLLGTDIMCSMPLMLQAHLILLSSRCIEIHIPTEEGKSDSKLTKNMINAFDLSVNLYVRYITGSGLIDSLSEHEDQSGCYDEEIVFGSCIRQLTHDKLDHQIDKLVDFCHVQSSDVFSGTKEDILESSVAYIVENQHVLDKKCRNEACSVLNYILSSIFWGETERNTLNEKKEEGKQEVYCIAAVLKLMSSSLLQILCRLKKEGFHIGVENLSGEYDHFLSIISCFGKYGADQPIQEILLGIRGRNHGFEETKLMLAHFASLFLSSFRTGLGIMFNGCILMLMATMNLVIFREGDLDVFGPLISDTREDGSPKNIRALIPKDLVCRRSSLVIASNLQKIQMLYKEERVRLLTYENHCTETRDGRSGITPETPSTKTSTYLSCLPDYQRNPSDFDDLIDFIDCTPGKDYAGWLKKRKRFNKWQLHRTRVVAKRQHRKKMLKKISKKTAFKKKFGGLDS